MEMEFCCLLSKSASALLCTGCLGNAAPSAAWLDGVPARSPYAGPVAPQLLRVRDCDLARGREVCACCRETVDMSHGGHQLKDHVNVLLMLC